MPALRMRARQVGHHNKCAVLPGKQNANQLGIFRRSLPSERTAPCHVSSRNPLRGLEPKCANSTGSGALGFKAYSGDVNPET